MKPSTKLGLFIVFALVCNCTKRPGFVLKGSSGPATAASVFKSVNLSREIEILDEGALVGDPSSFTFGVFELHLSRNEDCSNPVEAANYGDAGQYFEMTNNPTLFAAAPGEGTFQCIIIKYDDVIRFKSEVRSSNCGPNIQVSHDTYRSDSDETDWLDLDGNATPGSGTRAAPNTDKVYIYVTSTAGQAQLRASGYSENQMVSLVNPLELPGKSTLYWDLTNSVFDDEVTCNLAPETGFEFK